MARKWHCSECNGTEVSVRLWLNPNLHGERAIVDAVVESNLDSDDIYCAECDSLRVELFYQEEDPNVSP